MNKFLERLLLPSLGIFFIYCTFLFVFNLNLLGNALHKIHGPHILAILIIIFTSGFGVEIGLRLIRQTTPERRFLKFALCFAVYMFALQIFLTITPSVSACHCVSLNESIMNVLDWSKVEYSGGLLLWSIIVTSIFSRRENPQEDNT